MFSPRLTHAFNQAGISPADQSFIADIAARFPDVLTGFETAAEIDPPLRAIMMGYALKETGRRGWLRIGVPEYDVQTVADHSGMCTLLSFELYPDDDRLPPMMLWHDTTESIVTDFTPHDSITAPEKNRIERLGLVFLMTGAPRKKKTLDIWDEFESQKTPTSHRANDIDKLEMILQAQIYEQHYPHLKQKLKQFWDYVEPRLKTPEGRAFFEELKACHPEPHPLKLLVSQPYKRPWTKGYAPPMLPT